MKDNNRVSSHALPCICIFYNFQFNSFQMEDRLDIYNTSEEELASLAVYNVADSAVTVNTPNRAEKSLPKNLILKPTNALPDSSTIGRINTKLK